VFDAKEREALDFFEAIVRENADLLDMPEPIALEQRRCVPVSLNGDER
jgi:hypothetical protein